MCRVIAQRLARLTLCYVQSDLREVGQVDSAVCRVNIVRVVRLTLCCVQSDHCEGGQVDSLLCAE